MFLFIFSHSSVRSVHPAFVCVSVCVRGHSGNKLNKTALGARTALGSAPCCPVFLIPVCRLSVKTLRSVFWRPVLHCLPGFFCVDFDEHSPDVPMVSDALQHVLGFTSLACRSYSVPLCRFASHSMLSCLLFCYEWEIVREWFFFKKLPSDHFRLSFISSESQTRWSDSHSSWRQKQSTLAVDVQVKDR